MRSLVCRKTPRAGVMALNGTGHPVWLPIDSSFPKDFELLLQAHTMRQMPQGIEKCRKAFYPRH